MKRLPQRDPINAHKRQARAQRRVGVGARCAGCGETRPEALVLKSKPLRCADCVRLAKGHSLIDQHHVAGQHNHPLTVPVPPNDHRAELSTAQYDWPKDTRDNLSRSPLLAGAAMIRGFVDWVVYLLRKGVLWVADMLEGLDALLLRLLGANWWHGTEVARYAPLA